MRQAPEIACQRTSQTIWLAMLLSALLLSIAEAADKPTGQETPTPEVFVTDEGGTSSDPATKAALDNWRLQKARTAKESRPAHLDPEGNWGDPSSWMQMSIRFEKSSFKVGESVEAVLIMRNLDQRPREFLVTWPIQFSFGLSIFISGQPTPLLTRAEANATDDGMRRMARSVYKGHMYGLSPGTQQKFELRLSAIYDLTRPGSYLISASREIDDPETGGKSLISTKFAAFEIVPGDGPDSRTNAASGGSSASPPMPPMEARQTGAVPGTSFQSKSGLPQNSEASAKPHPPVAPSLAEEAATAPVENGWMMGLLIAAMAAFVGSILWVLRRRGGRP